MDLGLVQGVFLVLFQPISFVDNVPGLSGCVLRLELPDRNAKTYIVDNHFAKRQDAKAAVCLLAMSQNIDAHILSLREEVESKLPPAHRLAAQNIILPALRRITRSKGQTKPMFEFLWSEEGMHVALSESSPLT
jgi:hypothetical protein